jgi:hypothetical protein
MKLTIKNVEPIIESDITVRELTIIVGMNNTGKSLFAHAIHALYNEDLNYSIFIDFFKTNQYMIDLYNKFIQRRTNEYTFTKEELLKISVLITEYFGSPEVAKQIYNFIFSSNGIQDDMMISRDLTPQNTEDINKLYYQFNYFFEEVGNKKLILISKKKNSYTIEFSISQDTYENNCKSGKFLHNSVRFEFADFFARIFSKLSLFSKKTIVFPAERSGLTLMKDNLNYFPNKMTECYVEFLNQTIDTSKRSEDKYYNVAEYIEENILFGRLNFDPNKNIYFNDFNNTKDNIFMNRVSSSVRELAAFTLYLKFLVKANDTIIIDEPELSLHPDAVRYLARAIVSLVNKKLNFIVITHSDYFVKEINNLILLNTVDYEKNKIIINEKFNNNQLDNIQLSSNKVSMFSFLRDKNGIKKEEIICGEYGYIEPLFDKTIATMNKDEDFIFDLKELNQ